MLMIRLRRVGRRNDPSFRVVVVDKRRAAKAGRSVEILGSYNPRAKSFQFKEDRIKYWLSVGAKTSGTVHNLLVSKNVISGLKINVVAKPKKVKIASQETKTAEKPTDAKVAE
jgi:small subunit ribosomal protein S16